MTLGRFTDLTDELRDKFAGYRRAGQSVKTACALCNICEQTYCNWLKRARGGEEPFATFAQKVSEAKEEWIAEKVAQVNAACATDTKTALEVLKLRDPDKWSPYRTFRKFKNKIKDLSFNDQIKTILERVENGEMSQQEAYRFVQIIGTAAKVDESTRVEKLIAEAEERIDRKIDELARLKNMCTKEGQSDGESTG